MTDENLNQGKEKKSSGCLYILIGLFLFCMLIIFLDSEDEFEKFVSNTQSENENPYLYLANKDSKEYCINIDIRDYGLSTFCSKRNSKIEEFSHCFFHETGLTSEYAEELISTAMMYNTGSAYQISENCAADMAKGTVCIKYHGDGVYEKDRKKIDADVLDIKALIEEANELMVSTQCLNSFKKDKKTQDCSDKEIKKIEEKYNNLEKYQQEKNAQAKKKAEEDKEKRIPKEEKLAKKIGVSTSCLVVYENNYDYFDDEELYTNLKDKCSKSELDKLIDYFDFHPNEHLEDLSNGF